MSYWHWLNNPQDMTSYWHWLNSPQDMTSYPEIVKYYEYLGVISDENLTWEHHVLHITNKVCQKIGALARACQQLTINATQTFYLSVCASDIEYGSNAFYSSLSTAFKEKLVQLSKRGVRAVFKAPLWTTSAPLYEQINISTPLKRFEYEKRSAWTCQGLGTKFGHIMTWHGRSRPTAETRARAIDWTALQVPTWSTSIPVGLR